MRQTRGKHLQKEAAVLSRMILKYEKPKHHTFCGEKTEDVILLCNRNNRQITARQIQTGEVSMLAGGVRIQGQICRKSRKYEPGRSSYFRFTEKWNGSIRRRRRHERYGTPRSWNCFKVCMRKKERFCFASSTKVLWMNAKKRICEKNGIFAGRKKRTDADQFHFGL